MKTFRNETHGDMPLESKGEIVGRVQVQYVRCGKPTCHCSSGVLHGPYFYRNLCDGMRTRKVYVKSDEVEATRLACDRNALYKQELREIRARRRKIFSRIRQEWRKAQSLMASVSRTE